MRPSAPMATRRWTSTSPISRHPSRCRPTAGSWSPAMPRTGRSWPASSRTATPTRRQRDGRSSTTFISSIEQTTASPCHRRQRSSPSAGRSTVGDLSWIVARYGTDGTIIGRTATDFGTPAPTRRTASRSSPTARSSRPWHGQWVELWQPVPVVARPVHRYPAGPDPAADPGLLDFGAKVVGTPRPRSPRPS